MHRHQHCEAEDSEIDGIVVGISGDAEHLLAMVESGLLEAETNWLVVQWAWRVAHQAVTEGILHDP